MISFDRRTCCPWRWPMNFIISALSGESRCCMPTASTLSVSEGAPLQTRFVLSKGPLVVYREEFWNLKFINEREREREERRERTATAQVKIFRWISRDIWFSCEFHMYFIVNFKLDEFTGISHEKYHISFKWSNWMCIVGPITEYPSWCLIVDKSPSDGMVKNHRSVWVRSQSQGQWCSWSIDCEYQ